MKVLVACGACYREQSLDGTAATCVHCLTERLSLAGVRSPDESDLANRAAFELCDRVRGRLEHARNHRFVAVSLMLPDVEQLIELAELAGAAIAGATAIAADDHGEQGEILHQSGMLAE